MQKDCNKSMAFIQNQTYLTTPQRVQVHKTYIQPHIYYCNTIWGKTSQEILTEFFVFKSELVK